jgi:hypothetical protein
MKEQRESKKYLSQDSRRPRGDSNSGQPEWNSAASPPNEN